MMHIKRQAKFFFKISPNYIAILKKKIYYKLMSILLAVPFDNIRTDLSLKQFYIIKDGEKMTRHI